MVENGGAAKARVGSGVPRLGTRTPRPGFYEWLGAGFPQPEPIPFTRPGPFRVRASRLASCESGVRPAGDPGVDPARHAWVAVLRKAFRPCESSNDASVGVPSGRESPSPYDPRGSLARAGLARVHIPSPGVPRSRSLSNLPAARGARRRRRRSTGFVIQRACQTPKAAMRPHRRAIRAGNRAQ